MKSYGICLPIDKAPICAVTILIIDLAIFREELQSTNQRKSQASGKACQKGHKVGSYWTACPTYLSMTGRCLWVFRQAQSTFFVPPSRRTAHQELTQGLP